MGFQDTADFFSGQETGVAFDEFLVQLNEFFYAGFQNVCHARVASYPLQVLLLFGRAGVESLVLITVFFAAVGLYALSFTASLRSAAKGCRCHPSRGLGEWLYREFGIFEKLDKYNCSQALPGVSLKNTGVF